MVIFGHLGLRNPWTDSLEIWRVWLRPQSDPTCKIWWPPKMGGGVGIWWSCTLACFFNFFGSFNAPTAYPEKRGFSLSASKNVFRWWVCSFGVDLHRGSNRPLFAPKNHFSVALIFNIKKGWIRLTFWREAIGNTPYG